MAECGVAKKENNTTIIIKTGAGNGLSARITKVKKIIKG